MDRSIEFTKGYACINNANAAHTINKGVKRGKEKIKLHCSCAAVILPSCHSIEVPGKCRKRTFRRGENNEVMGER